MIVAVRHPDPDNPEEEIKVVSPSDMCRKLIDDYGKDCKVIEPV